MIPLRTVIVEDIPAELQLIQNLLAAYCPNVEVVGATGRLLEAVDLIEQTHPDLLLMDVEITGGTSYDLLDRLQKKGVPMQFEVIFITGHLQFGYAMSAFAYSAIDFLTKAIDPVKLRNAVERVAERRNPQQYQQQIQLLMELVRSPDSHSRRMAVHLTRGVIEFINVEDIMYLEADGVTTRFCLTESKSLVAARNLGQYEAFLTQHRNFFSISNSLLVNLDQMQRYDHAEKAVTMVNGTVLYASRRGGQDLRNRLNR